MKNPLSVEMDNIFAKNQLVRYRITKQTFEQLKVSRTYLKYTILAFWGSIQKQAFYPHYSRRIYIFR